MRKRNKVKQLQRTSEHRKAMLINMVVSLFLHEQIRSTEAKLKVARSFAERLITIAKKNSLEGTTPEAKIHNIRLVGKYIKDRQVLLKLFEDIAPRYENRVGGYTRIIKLGFRPTDKSEMSLLELVDKKDKVILLEDQKLFRDRFQSKRIKAKLAK